ncbi:uncharacterized protein LOC108041507 [Drosophila rhopaloa]|uniref:Uncharacterized protein LOC108041507 n=1 Tax=Drosophila rhopaloa TaxID=1041015 RepID=A0A6P4EA80_DRORH|nr:uncharacterized protein LOC108041507 [Drosophila rhopaloa]
MDKDNYSCRLAWKSLRDRYKYHLNCKRPKSESAGGVPLEKPTGVADFAPYMSLLPDLLTQRQTTRSCFSKSEGAHAIEVSYLEAEAELEVGLSELPEELYSYGGGRKNREEAKGAGITSNKNIYKYI